MGWNGLRPSRAHAAFAVVALSLSLSLSAGARGQGLEIGIDRPGGDYSSFDLPEANPALCESTCRNDSVCRAFTYVNPGVQGASARCWLKNVVPPQVASNCCVSGVIRGDTPAADGGRFVEPVVTGYGVDICLNWGANCGKPAADEFCRRQGFAESSSSTVREDAPPTLVLGDNAVCGEGFCDRFSEIVCTASTPPVIVGGNPDDLWRASATDKRGMNGQRFPYSCPPIASIPSVSIWGTGIYTDDLAVCIAAVHAGAISAATGGTVTIEIAAGQPSYAASTQNGVGSSGYGSWYGSYTIVGAGAACRRRPAAVWAAGRCPRRRRQPMCSGRAAPAILVRNAQFPARAG